MNNRCSVAALLIPLILTAMTAHGAAPLQPGDGFPDFAARDQHGVDYRFETGTQAVLIAFDMASAKLANEVLAGEDAEFLPDHRAVYISNIYGMPAIGRYFAFSKMRKYPHRIVLADGEHLLDAFPRNEGHVTVIRLDDRGVVQTIRFWNPQVDSLQDFLEGTPAE